MCGAMFQGPYQLDHVIPFCLVGENTPVFAICGSCHDYKTRVEAAAIRRTRALLAEVAHPTFGVCFLCGDIISSYFLGAHRCRIREGDPYAHLRPSVGGRR